MTAAKRISMIAQRTAERDQAYADTRTHANELLDCEDSDIPAVIARMTCSHKQAVTAQIKLTKLTAEG